jgi:hypothetical protein
MENKIEPKQNDVQLKASVKKITAVNLGSPKEEESEKLYCDVCQKCMTDKNGSSFVAANFGVDFKENTTFTPEFYLRQMGQYSLNKPYYVCWECYLKAFNVKP